MSGSVIALEQVPDSTFASGLLGKGSPLSRRWAVIARSRAKWPPVSD